MYHKITVVGNLGGEPELHQTPPGRTVCNFSVASNRRWKGQEGETEEETIWFRVAVWGRQAEACHQFLFKGRQVLVEGRLTPHRETGGPRVWIDKHGEPRASYDLTAIEVKFLDGKPPEIDDRSDDRVEAAPAAYEDETTF